MLKKSSLGSWSPSPTKCPRLLWVIRRPGRLPTLTRWSSRRRLWELAIKSNSSSVWGDVVIAGSKRSRGGWKKKSNVCKLSYGLTLLWNYDCRIPDHEMLNNQPIMSFRLAAASRLSPFCGSSRWQRWSSMRLLWNLLRRSKKQSSSDGSRPSFCKGSNTFYHCMQK